MKQQLMSEKIKDPVFFQVYYLGQIPHEKQAEVLRSKAKNKVVCCGRRSGKTQMLAGELIRRAVIREEEGGYKKQILIAPTYKQALIVFHKIIELIRYSPRGQGDIASSPIHPHPKIIWNNRRQIDFASADNPDSLRGEGYDFVVEDESAFIKGKKSRDAIKPLTFDTGAPHWKLSTPHGNTGEFFESAERAKRGEKGYEYFHYNYKDNPYLAKEGIEEIEAEIEEFGENNIYVQTEIFGNFVSAIDVYFERDLIEFATVDYDMVKL